MAPSLTAYLNQLKKDCVPFDCPHCDVPLLPEHFEHHCAIDHHYEPDLRCVWCFGHMGWPPHQKKLHAAHLLHCFKAFCESYVPKTAFPPPFDGPTLLPLEPMCTPAVYADNFPTPDLPAGDIWPVILGLDGLTYQHDGLNLAVACLQYYLRSNKNTDWYHILIKPQAYKAFLVACDSDAGSTRTLPFSCFCRGGGAFHRHLIVLTEPKGHFMKIFWKKVMHKKSFFRKEAIESPLQLLHLVGHLSQLRSNCRFSFEPRASPHSPEVHYFVNVALPPLYKILMALQWDEGILELVREEYARVEPHALASVAQWTGDLWVIRVGDLPGILKDLVIPVSAQFVPCQTPTRFQLHLSRRRKLYFEEQDDVSPVHWVEMQAERGNRLYDAVADDLYYPTPYQQKCLSMLRSQSVRLQELEVAAADTTATLQCLSETVEKGKRKHRKLARLYRASEEALKDLQTRHIRYLEKENDLLTLENTRAKRMRFSRWSC